MRLGSWRADAAEPSRQGHRHVRWDPRPRISDTKRVADPVHGYVSMTPIERELIDRRPAQRLRYVSQAGLAHLVFPDLRTSRFIHSLGTMHLASRFLAGSLSRADAEASKAAQRAVEEAVREAVGPVSTAGKAAEDLNEDGLLSHWGVEPRYRASFIVAEQGLRLAALFHDLGHLPFSHDFEYAVNQLAADPELDSEGLLGRLLENREGREVLHERIGHALTFLLLRDAFADTSSEGTRASFTFARRILEAPEAQTAQKVSEIGGLDSAAEGALAWLHTLIAGELDVDRCDYLLRDARSYGFEFARFDLERLVDNLTVVQDPDDEHALLPAVRPQGQAAVESFLIARARMYQWGPRHHKVAQVGAALRYCIGQLLRSALASEASGVSHGLHPFLKDIETILSADDSAEHGELLLRFAGYDDQWWMSHLRAADQADEWFGLVCWRARGPRSLWKRAVDFAPDELAAWNSRLPARDEVERLRDWDDAVRELEHNGVLVVRHRFEPWKASLSTAHDADPESALCFYDQNQDLVPVSRVSFPVASLREAWAHDVQVHAFARSDAAISASEVIERLLPDPGGA